MGQLLSRVPVLVCRRPRTRAFGTSVMQASVLHGQVKACGARIDFCRTSLLAIHDHRPPACCARRGSSKMLTSRWAGRDSGGQRQQSQQYDCRKWQRRRRQTKAGGTLRPAAARLLLSCRHESPPAPPLLPPAASNVLCLSRGRLTLTPASTHPPSEPRVHAVPGNAVEQPGQLPRPEQERPVRRLPLWCARVHWCAALLLPIPLPHQAGLMAKSARLWTCCGGLQMMCAAAQCSLGQSPIQPADGACTLCSNAAHILVPLNALYINAPGQGSQVRTTAGFQQAVLAVCV